MLKTPFERLNEIIAQLDEINTRLDLIEECLGEQYGPWPTQLMELDQAGTHPPDCRCAWCEPPDIAWEGQ